jgi:hypothetical protein
MVVQSKREKRTITCPEGIGKPQLFLEWRDEDGREILNSIYCDNLHLRDLSGGDCQWSCWEKVSR